MAGTRRRALPRHRWPLAGTQLHRACDDDPQTPSPPACRGLRSGLPPASPGPSAGASTQSPWAIPASRSTRIAARAIMAAALQSGWQVTASDGAVGAEVVEELPKVRERPPGKRPELSGDLGVTSDLACAWKAGEPQKLV